MSKMLTDDEAKVMLEKGDITRSILIERYNQMKHDSSYCQLNLDAQISLGLVRELLDKYLHCHITEKAELQKKIASTLDAEIGNLITLLKYY